jgi:hypothetical protein
MALSGMSPDRVRLLAAMREQMAAGSPLTATQEGIWLAEQVDPGLSGYHDTAVIQLEGPLDADGLRDALLDAQHNHEALRARIADVGGALRQFFDVGTADWREVNLSGIAAAAQPDRLERLVSALATGRFDLAAGPLWRARLVRLATERHVLVMVMHHLITDGWSHGLLLEALLAGYADRNDRVAAPPARHGYAGWLARRVRRERAVAVGDAPIRAAAELRGVPYRLRLPELDPASPDRSAAEVPIPLSAAAWAAFERCCRETGVTRFMALAGLFALTLSRAADRDGVLMSMPLAGRYDASDAGLLGCLINVVPLDVRVTAADTPGTALHAGAAAMSRALCLAEVPYRTIVRALGPLSPGDDPLTNVGIQEFNAPTDQTRLESLRVLPLPRTALRLRHDLELSVPRTGGLPATLLYPVSRWPTDRISRLAADMAELIQVITGTPGVTTP